MSSSKIRLGIIGMGGIGREHLRNFMRFSDQVVVEAICDVDSNRLEPFQKTSSIPKITTDVEEFFRAPLDAVCISTPNITHYPLAKRALLQGWHVLCEKPFTIEAREAEELWNLSEQKNLVGMLAFSYRFVPSVKMLSEIINQGKAGKIYHVRCYYLQSWLSSPCAPFSWRLDATQAGTGVLGDLGAHVFDAVRFVTGHEFLRICAFAKTFIPQRRDPISGETKQVTVDDAVAVWGEIEGGGLFTAEMSRCATGRGNFLAMEINGEGGGFAIDVERPMEIGFCPDVMTEYTDFQTNFAVFPCPSSFGEQDNYYSQTETFVKVLQGERLSFPSFFDGWQCQKIVDACSKSIQVGGRVEVEKSKIK